MEVKNVNPAGQKPPSALVAQKKTCVSHTLNISVPTYSFQEFILKTVMTL